MAKAAAPGKRWVRLLLISLVLLIAGYAWLLRLAYQEHTEGQNLRLDRVYALAEAGQIKSARLLDEDAQIIGERCVTRPAAAGATPDATAAPPPAPADSTVVCPEGSARFHTAYPRSDAATQQLIERLVSSGAEVSIDKQTATAIVKILVTFIFPLVILANLLGLIFLSRSGEGSVAEVAGFGTIARKRQRKRRTGTGVTFANIAGAGEAVAELREVVDYLRDPKKFEAYGASAPKGVLLFGPPGCGKTLLARAVAGETGVPFFSVSGTEFVESLVGVGAARIRDLFRQVREVAPAIVFIDEIDAVGRRRSGEGATGGEREQTVNQLLVELDGFEVTSGIVLMGATNRPDILDPALMRPGRFDRHVTLEPPDVNGRREILELYAANKPIADDGDLSTLARRTPGFTGADLANVINEAALLAIREGEGTKIHDSHLNEAVQRVLHGPQRRGRLMTAEERKRLAFHESGHAVVAAALGHAREIHRISIVARGRSLGQSVLGDEADRVLLTGEELEAELAIAMGGIAAEEVTFGRSSTTAQNDIDRATRLAREMVGLYGMSPDIGRVRLISGDEGFLGSDGAVMDTVSGATMQEFDGEVKRLIQMAERLAKDILSSRAPILERLAAVLEEKENLEGTTLESLLAQVGPEVNAFANSTTGRSKLNGERESPSRTKTQ